MGDKYTIRFLMLASYPDSVLNFRGELLKELIRFGLDVHVAAPNWSRNSQVRQGLELLGVTVHEVDLQRAGMNLLQDAKSLYLLWRLMRKVKPHYSIAYTIKPVIYGTLAAWVACVPRRIALITGLGFAFVGSDGKRSVLRRMLISLYRLSLSQAHTVFFQNPDDQKLFLSLGILNSDKTSNFVLNGSGVDVEFFSIASFPQQVRFLLIARLLGDKGVREYVRAAAIVRQTYPWVRFALAGWIDENPDAISDGELQQWINSGNIEFLGRLDDVRPAIQNCSVYVLPSSREGTPRTVLEAMAMGRPIITTNAPGCRETVIDGENGFLVSVKSVSELAEAMGKFCEYPDIIQPMGKRSREIAKNKYDVRKVNAAMLRGIGIQ